MDLYWHIDETGKIARELGFGWCACLCLVHGNADVDLKHWGDEHAHGMTKAKDDGTPTESAADAEKAWQKWVDDNLRDAKKEIEAGRCCNALYKLGRAIHSIQDREAHQGMTNAEHSVLEWEGDSPDDDAAGKRRAKKRTKELLEAFLASLTGAQRTALKRCKCSDALTVAGDPYDFDPIGFKTIGILLLIGRKRPKHVQFPPSKKPVMPAEEEPF